jgi:uncharacterized protein (TIGR02147 family)
MENTENYRNILKNTLRKKTQDNPMYSLRAFARDIGMGASSLSEVLNGKKNLSIKMANQISIRLDFSKKMSEKFITLVQFETTKNSNLKNIFKTKLSQLDFKNERKLLDLQLFDLMSSWYFVVILELTNLRGFFFSAKNVADTIGIKIIEAHNAIEILEKFNLIKKVSEGKYVKTSTNILVSSERKSQSLRNFMKEVFIKLSNEVETGNSEERFLGTETFVFDKKLLSEANEILEDCFNKIIKLSEKSTQRNSVYQLGIQLVPFTKNRIKI